MISYDEEGNAVPVTILQLAYFRLGLQPDANASLTGEDFDRVSLPIMGGCSICHASIAAYNACPSKSGYLKCLNGCIDDDGWYDVEQCNRDMFPLEYEWKGVQPQREYTRDDLYTLNDSMVDPEDS